MLDPDWLDKLNLSLVSISRDPYSSNILYTWVFTLKKPSLLEELPFAPKLIRIYDPRLGAIIQQFKKIRNIVGEIQTSDPDFTWPITMRISFDTPGIECTHKRDSYESTEGFQPKSKSKLKNSSFYRIPIVHFCAN
jgi:hypothetical protein